MEIQYTTIYECHKSSSKREIHSGKCLPQEVLKISNKQFYTSGSEKNKWSLS